MGNTFNSQLMHCVFSTKERRPFLNYAVRERLFAYMGGIARENGMKAIAIGGVEDHVHILLSLPTTLSVSKAMQLLKGNSSKWIHENFPDQSSFGWQEGYGAFSIGVGDVARTVAYISNQDEHHRKTDFKAELISFLKKHEIEFDERYIWK